MVLDPVVSCDLVNPAVKKLIDIFSEGFEVLYVYGPPGTGKSLALQLLLDEYNYEVFNLQKMPNTEIEVQALSRHNSLLESKPIAVLVDGIDQLTKKDISTLMKGDWNYNKLILVGSTWKRGNPLARIKKNKKFDFKKVKFAEFEESIITNLLLRLALKYKSSLTLNERTRIAKESKGDLRKALDCTKYYLLGGRKDLDAFLPTGEEQYFNRIRKMFSGDYESALEEVESFGWYFSIMIMAENLKEKKDAAFLEVLAKLNNGKLKEKERYLALFACEMSKKHGKGKYSKWVFPKRRKKEEDRDPDVLCSAIKKELYFL
jgi:DNA polymerase III delta prime subunit